MKKLTLLLLIVMAVALTACTGSGDSEPSLLDTILEEGVIVMGTSPDYPPFEFIDPSKTGVDQYVGADIELGKYIAEQLGVEFQLEVSDFSTVLASVGTGRVDMAIAGLAYKEDRLESMDFTFTYNPSSDGFQGLLVLAENVDKYSSLSDFSGLKIGAQSGSLQESFAKEQIPDVVFEPFSAIGDGVLLLQAGRVDAIAIASTTGNQYVNANSDLAMSTVFFEESTLAEYDGSIIGVPKGETELVDKLNEIIADVLEQGLFAKWLEEYTEYANEILTEE